MGNNQSARLSTNHRNATPRPSIQSNHNPTFIKDRFYSYDELEQGLRKAGLESCQLIIGIDFTKSNTWQGGHPFYAKNNLHSLEPYPNPYHQVLEIMCRSLSAFDDDGLIPAYGFGDTKTTNKFVFSFLSDSFGQEIPCVRLEGVLAMYNKIIHDINSGFIQMSGPTTFAPLIYKAIDIVKVSGQYHILLIICDGAVDDKRETINAIIAASNYPLSIVCIGVGKGPWKVMEEFDDAIVGRKFDNFQFVDFAGTTPAFNKRNDGVGKDVRMFD